MVKRDTGAATTERIWLNTAALAKDYADLLIPLIVQFPVWVFRRVETVRFINDHTIMVRVSTDYDLSALDAGAEYLEIANDGFVPAVLLPLGFLSKQPLEDFDLRDRDGKPMTLLTERETTPIATEMLMRIAGDIVGHEQAELVRVDLQEVVGGDEDASRKSLAELGTHSRAGIEGVRIAQKLNQDAGFRYIATLLASKFLALAVHGESPDGRDIVKYAYATSVSWKYPRRVRDWLSRFGIWPALMDVDLPLVRLSGSYHIDVEAPAQLEFRRVKIVGYSGETGTRSILRQVIGKMPRAHLHWKQQAFTDNTSYRLRLAVAPQRRGFVRASFIASLFAAVALLVAYYFHERIASLTTPAAASLLLIVPGLITAHLSRPSEHPVATRLYFGLRLTLGLTALFSWGAACAIVLQLTPSELGLALLICLAVAVVATAVCFGALVAATIKPIDSN